MSRFNQPVSPAKPDTTNLAGGAAFTMSDELEIVTILLTSFLKNKFYETADLTVQRLQQLIRKLQSEDAIRRIAKAVIYARTEFGMRSITHVAAAELAQKVSSYSWAKRFFEKVIYRPDDMTEIMSYTVASQGKKRMPNIHAMQKGFAAAIQRFKPYQLAKYRSSDKAIKLVDAINWAHPKPVDLNREAIALLMKGELKQESTWEALLSAAGSDPVKKAEVWSGLIRRKELGYLALLRNLRNIMDQAPLSLSFALESLINPDFIKKSLILPFQYMTALDEIEKHGNSAMARVVTVAISKAIDISLSNVPAFEGDTLVVLDVSGSMVTAIAGEKQTAAKIGALFAAVLAKASNADLMTFDGDARYVKYNPLDTTTTLAKSIHFTGGSTNFPSIFVRIDKKYDRIIILSDMQGWDERTYGSPLHHYLGSYRSRLSANPLIYSFDLQGYGTLQVPEARTFLLAGFSDKTMGIMRFLEKDKNALLTEIDKIEL